MTEKFICQGLYSLWLNHLENSLAKCYSAIGLNVVTKAPQGKSMYPYMEISQSHRAWSPMLVAPKFPKISETIILQ